MWNKHVLFKVLNRMLVVTLLVSCFLPVNLVEANNGNIGSEEISSVLRDYSHYMMGEPSKSENMFSKGAQSLIQERRDYYADFFEIGLHANLDRIESEFVMDDSVKLSASDDLSQVVVTEVVTMSGTPRTTNSADYPLIQAAKWAIEQTENKAVIASLEGYIDNMEEGVAASVKDGVKIVFIVRHNMDFQNKDGSPQLMKDNFTDKSIDNVEGFDNVNWENGELIRSGMDLEEMPDYVIYNTPIEELGKTLLEDYAKVPPDVTTLGTGFFYNRGGATNYINTYSSNPSTICPGSSVVRNTGSYNYSYYSVWNAAGCADCVDYVSQALRAGSFPTDGTWYVNIGSYAWVNTTGLYNYLNSIAAITPYSSYTSLQTGDISFTSSRGHVIMVGGVNPHRFGGHTNDRLLYPWSTSLVEHVHINSYIP